MLILKLLVLLFVIYIIIGILINISFSNREEHDKFLQDLSEETGKNITFLSFFFSIISILAWGPAAIRSYIKYKQKKKQLDQIKSQAKARFKEGLDPVIEVIKKAMKDPNYEPSDEEMKALEDLENDIKKLSEEATRIKKGS